MISRFCASNSSSLHASDYAPPRAHRQRSPGSAVSHPREADLDALIQLLVEAGIEFIVVGGAAAVLHGAPTTTRDLDIVHRRTVENVDRLVALLERLDAVIREPGNRRLRPSASLLLGNGQLNLSTQLGPLDPLCILHDGRGYDELLPLTEIVSDEAVSLRVLDLPTLIAVKAAAGRPKDRIVVPILLALLAERHAGKA